MAGEIDLGIDELSDFQVIGRGGFSTIFSAHDRGFNRRVAVKLLHSLDDAGLRRFDRERGIMGQLSSHPNVIMPFRAGYTATGAPYLVMELVQGGSLQELIDRRGSVPWNEAVELVLPVVAALGHAHEQGILHRDVKPANVVLAGRVPKLTDFGIAAIRESTTTQVAYTLAHCPPEAFATGEDTRDERSDLYSVASTLYNLITGRPPYQVEGQDSPHAYMFRIMDHPVPPVPEDTVPPPLAAFLQAGLAKNPDLRPQTAAEFEAQLRAILSAWGPGVITGPSAQPLQPGQWPAQWTGPGTGQTAGTGQGAGTNPATAETVISGPGLSAPPYGASQPAAAAPPYGASQPGAAAPQYGASQPGVSAPGYGASQPAAAAPPYSASQPGVSAPGYGVSQDGTVVAGAAVSGPGTSGGGTGPWGPPRFDGAGSTGGTGAAGAVITGEHPPGLAPVVAPRRRTGRLVALAGVAVVLVAAMVGAGLWWTSRGGPPQVVWQYETNSSLASRPAIAGGTLVIGAQVTNKVHAVDIDTGDERWVYPTGGGVSAGPAIADEVVYIGSLDGIFHAINLLDGAQVWQADLGAEVTGGALVFDADLVVVGSGDGSVHGLERATGDIRWTFATGGTVNSTPAAVERDGTTVIVVGSTDQSVYFLDPATGTDLDTVALEGGVWFSQPLVLDKLDGSGQEVWIGSSGQNAGQLNRIDVESGDVKPFYVGGGVGTAPALSNDGYIIAGDDIGELFAVDRQTVGEVWREGYAEDTQVKGSPVVYGDEIIFGTHDKDLIAVADADGAELWRFKGEQIFGLSAPVIVDDQLYVGNDSGTVYRFDLS